MFTAFAGDNGVVTGRGTGTSENGSTVTADIFATGQDGHDYGTVRISEGTDYLSAITNPSNSLSFSSVTSFSCYGSGGIGGGNFAKCIAQFGGDGFFNCMWTHTVITVTDTRYNKDTVTIKVYWPNSTYVLYSRTVTFPPSAFTVLIK